jgi:hypothetical protein
MAFRPLIIALAVFIAVLVFILTAGVVKATDTVSTVSSSTVVDKTPPTASSPSIVINQNDICQTGNSAALQTSFLGLSGGTTQRDMTCELLKLSKYLFASGMKVASLALACQDARIWNAMWDAGTTCPVDALIGSKARAFWLANPDRAPEGAVIRVKAKVDHVENDYPGDE